MAERPSGALWRKKCRAGARLYATPASSGNFKMTGNDFNSEFFSNEKQFRVGKFTITVIPSIYKESSSQWSDTIVTSCKSICDKNVYRYEIHPGSDRVKIILSSDQCYIAIVCESQWYEDLYIFDVPHLKKIASFEGINYVDGASI